MFDKKFWIAFFIIGITGTLMHFVYEWSGENPIVGVFAPVNESIWEHGKLIFFPSIAFSGIAYLKFSGPRNDPAATLMGVLSGMAAIITLYYTYSGIIGKNIDAINIGLFFVGVAVFLTVRRLIRKNRALTGDTANIVSLIALIAISILFAVWTYIPPNLGIFKDIRY